MKERRPYIPFSYKTMVPYLLLILLTDAAIGLYSYRTAVRSSTALVEANVGWAMEQMRDNVLYQMSDLQAVSDSLFSSPSFQRDLQAEGPKAELYDATVHRLLPLLETPLKMTAQNVRLTVYVKNPGIAEIYGSLDAPIKEKSYALLSMSRLAGESWYAELASSGTDNVWRQVGSDREQGNISLLRKLISFADYTSELGFLRISVPTEQWFGTAGRPGLGEDAILVVKAKTGGASRILYASAEKGASMPTDRYLTVAKPVPGLDLTLEAHIARKTLRQDAGRIGGLTILVCGASFLAASAIAMAVARFSGRKMQRIVFFARAFRDGFFSKRVPVAGYDEFAQISAAFNQMAEHIDGLIREVYQKEIQKKEAELQALEAQINPHFLYNTLSSISSLAHIGQPRQLSAMVSGLAQFYRLTLNEGRSVIAVAKELEQARCYLDIQAIKYANRLSASYDVEPAIMSCPTIKLILQPFVENALKHAWFGERIHIRIDGRRDGDRIELRVIDDGIGMTAQRIEQVKRDMSRGEGGCGIRNVNERIRLQYGDGYGVKLFSRLGIGTTVRILLPYSEGPS